MNQFLAFVNKRFGDRPLPVTEYCQLDCAMWDSQTLGHRCRNLLCPLFTRIISRKLEEPIGLAIFDATPELGLATHVLRVEHLILLHFNDGVTFSHSSTLTACMVNSQIHRLRYSSKRESEGPRRQAHTIIRPNKSNPG